MFFFFVKQKTAYEMRISDWSSDVCSSDLTFGSVKRYRRIAEASSKISPFFGPSNSISPPMTNRSETPASSSNPCSPSPPKFPNHSICFSPALGSNWSSDSCACAKSEKLTDRHIVRASVKCFIGGRCKVTLASVHSVTRCPPVFAQIRTHQSWLYSFDHYQAPRGRIV